MSANTAILVVEDEPLVRMDIADQLSDEGYTVFEAATADQAIDLLDSEPSIRLMFTNIDMPGSMDGLRLAAAVHDRWPPVRIIVTSGHRHVCDADLPSGGIFFAKPYRHADVIASFHRLLGD